MRQRRRPVLDGRSAETLGRRVKDAGPGVRKPGLQVAIARRKAQTAAIRQDRPRQIIGKQIGVTLVAEERNALIAALAKGFVAIARLPKGDRLFFAGGRGGAGLKRCFRLAQQRRRRRAGLRALARVSRPRRRQQDAYQQTGDDPQPPLPIEGGTP